MHIQFITGIHIKGGGILLKHFLLCANPVLFLLYLVQNEYAYESNETWWEIKRKSAPKMGILF